MCNEGGDVFVSTVREIFSGRVVHFPNRRNDLPQVTHDTFFDIPYGFGIFHTRGSVLQLRFSKGFRRENTDLQAVALICTYCEMSYEY